MLVLAGCHPWPCFDSDTGGFAGLGEVYHHEIGKGWKGGPSPALAARW